MAAGSESAERAGIKSKPAERRARGYRNRRRELEPEPEEREGLVVRPRLLPTPGDEAHVSRSWGKLERCRKGVATRKGLMIGRIADILRVVDRSLLHRV